MYQIRTTSTTWLCVCVCLCRRKRLDDIKQRKLAELRLVVAPC